MEWLDSVVTVVASAVIFFYVKSLKGDIKEVKADLKRHEDKCSERNEKQALTIGALIHKTSGNIPTD